MPIFRQHDLNAIRGSSAVEKQDHIGISFERFARKVSEVWPSPTLSHAADEHYRRPEVLGERLACSGDAPYGLSADPTGAIHGDQIERVNQNEVDARIGDAAAGLLEYRLDEAACEVRDDD